MVKILTILFVSFSVNTKDLAASSSRETMTTREPRVTATAMSMISLGGSFWKCTQAVFGGEQIKDPI